MSNDQLPSDGLPSAQDLDAMAEEQRLAELAASAVLSDDATVTKVNDSVAYPNSHLCSCGTPRLPDAPFCQHCGQEFTQGFETKREPILDEDGTEHKGHRIRLIGEGWPNELFRISDPSVTDEVLEAQIKGLQQLLQRAIQTQDYCQISIAAREFELGYRKHSRYVAAVRRREKLTTQGAIRLNQKAYKKGAVTSVPADIAALMKLGNLTYEQAVALKACLGKKS
jgi:hypothetical protein